VFFFGLFLDFLLLLRLLLEGVFAGLFIPDSVGRLLVLAWLLTWLVLALGIVLPDDVPTVPVTIVLWFSMLLVSVAGRVVGLNASLINGCPTGALLTFLGPMVAELDVSN
jgi:hypothetical protein